MNKSRELRTTTELVKAVLREYPQARNSDDFLYCKVCELLNNRSVSLPFSTVMLDRKRLGLPAMESVRRSRQKMQALYPELKGNSDVEAGRMLNEGIFKEYARK